MHVRIGHPRQAGSASPNSQQGVLELSQWSIGVDNVVPIQHNRRIVVARAKPEVVTRILRKKRPESPKKLANFRRAQLWAFVPPKVGSGACRMQHVQQLKRAGQLCPQTRQRKHL